MIRGLGRIVRRTCSGTENFGDRLSRVRVSPDSVLSLGSLRGVPILGGSQLPRLRSTSRPFKDLSTMGPGRVTQVFVSPKPVCSPRAARGSF